MITLLMGIAVVTIGVTNVAPAPAAVVVVASVASCAAALRADLSIGVGGKFMGGVCGSS